MCRLPRRTRPLLRVLSSQVIGGAPDSERRTRPSRPRVGPGRPQVEGLRCARLFPAWAALELCLRGEPGDHHPAVSPGGPVTYRPFADSMQREASVV